MPTEPAVHIVDDDDAARDSLKFLLTSAGFSAVTYDSAASFLSLMPGAAKGCVITDVRMPDIDGIALLRKIKEQPKSLPVIVITGHGDVPLAVEAMKIGALDFLEKPYDDEQMIAAVKRALQIQEHIITSESDRLEIEQRIQSLTAREQQVLQGLIAGKPNKVIAFDLSISPRTVEIYRANVMTKMGVKSLSELVRMALTAGTFS